ncbi:MAG: LD-carboxypeptidase [Eubacteriales bacterium]|nr:LD-carboxypeptidase [Eubacteriales bacterium]
MDLGTITLDKGNRAAIVCCSNGQPQVQKERLHRLKNTLLHLGLIPVFSEYIYERDSVFSGTAKERAESLMSFYQDVGIKAIFDISGGDIANEILPYLDYEQIGKSEKIFWGYSDLTTVINAIYAKTGKASVLYQIKNLTGKDAGMQISNFTGSVFEGKEDLFSFNYEFVQKSHMHGTVVGGNIRCLLKLAGTPFWPDMKGKILLLESRGGTVAQMVTYLNQLKQIGVFGEIRGILLGTFTRMEEEHCFPDIVELVKKYAGEQLPIAKTEEIGHGSNSKGILIGQEISMKVKFGS